MLELKEYTREELIAIYKTTRLDAIKNKVTREGYKYTNCGRGKDYKMVITLLPNKNNAFKEYCIKNLGFAAQTDFLKLKVFINAILSNDDFLNLQYSEMARELKRTGTDITRQTVAEYFKKLDKLNWFGYDLIDCNYFIYDSANNKARPITREEYKAAWAAYWEGKYNNTNEAIKSLYQLCGGTPKKTPKVQLNGFYNNQYKDLLELIKE